MTPYRSPFSGPLTATVFSLILLVTLGVTPAGGTSPAEKGNFEALTQSGFEHFYSLEYDQAIGDFQKALEARPDEPKAFNHLLEARLFQQLYKYNALDTRLYTKQRFLTSKQVPIDPAARRQRQRQWPLGQRRRFRQSVVRSPAVRCAPPTPMLRRIVHIPPDSSGN